MAAHHHFAPPLFAMRLPNRAHGGTQYRTNRPALTYFQTAHLAAYALGIARLCHLLFLAAHLAAYRRRLWRVFYPLFDDAAPGAGPRRPPPGHAENRHLDAGWPALEFLAIHGVLARIRKNHPGKLSQKEDLPFPAGLKTGRRENEWPHGGKHQVAPKMATASPHGGRHQIPGIW